MNNFQDKLKIKLDILSFKQQLIFAILTCEKMKYSYISFSKMENWGNIKLLDSILTKAYSIVLGSNIEKKEIKRLLESLEKNAPNLDEFEDNTAKRLELSSKFIPNSR